MSVHEPVADGAETEPGRNGADIASRSEFAEQLSRLRTSAGRPMRDLAQRLDVPVSTLSGWMTGRHLPNLRQLDLLRRLLGELGLDAAATATWVEALHRVRQAPGPRPADAPTPYRGLEPFGEDDADLFFGRTRAVDAVIERVRHLRARPGVTRLVVVVAASGSGKSSLLRAGVVPKLRTAGAPVAVTTPGADPVGTLGAALHEVRDAGRAGPAYVVIDQLEEAFTLAAADDRDAFFAALTAAATQPDGPSFVAALRADFYAALVGIPGMATVAQDQQVVLTPMSTDELRDAIVGPAQRSALTVEPQLVEIVLRDFVPPTGGPNAGGALPLLSHALLQTWTRARRGELTVADYLAAGGLAGAVEATAEQVHDSLTTDEREAARRLFLRLVNVDADGVVTRRPLPLRDIADSEVDAFESTMLRFVSGRLLTLDDATVQMSHEALLHAWPRLRAWVDAERDSLTVRRELEQQVALWQHGDRDPAALATGSRLERYTTWASGGGTRWLGRPEQEFLSASVERVERDARSARRRRRVLIGFAAVSAALAMIASTLAVVALRARNTADRERNDALSRRIALQADRLRSTDPTLAAALAVVGHRTSGTVEARSALLDSTARALPTRLFGGEGPTALAGDAAGTLLAVSDAAGSAVQLHRIADGKAAKTIRLPLAPDTMALAMAMTPDGARLAVGGTDRSVTVWDLRADPPSAVTVTGLPGTVTALAIRADGAEMAAGVAGRAADDAAGTAAVPPSIRRWALGAPSPTDLGVLTLDALPKAVAYRPDGRALASGGEDGVLRLWTLDGSNATPAATADPVGKDQLFAVAFDPAGRRVAAGYRSNKLRVFGVETGTLTDQGGPDTGFTTWVNSVTFSADGNELTAGSSDSSVRSWSSDGYALRRRFVGPASVTGVAYVDGGRQLAAVSTDGALRLWSLAASPLSDAGGRIYTVAFPGDGRRVAAFSSAGLRLWTDGVAPSTGPAAGPPRTDLPLGGAGAVTPDGSHAYAGSTTGPSIGWDLRATTPAELPTTLEGPTDLVEAVAVSADGKLLAIGGDDGAVHLWSLADPSRPTKLPPVLQATSQILNLAFDPTSTLLAGASADDLVYLWSVREPSAPTQLAALDGFENDAQAVAFSDDGELLAGGSADDTVKLWDIRDPASPRAVGPVLRGPRNSVFGLDFQPGTRLLAAASSDSTAWLWDVAQPTRPRVVAALRASSAALYTISFSPDGRRLAAAGTDRTVYLWDVDPAQAEASVCDRLGDDLTTEEWQQYLADLPVDPAGACR